MKLLLQFPEGLKQFALKHARKLESEGHEVYISATPNFGACDLAIDEAKALGADKLMHFGHAEFSKVDFPVEYLFYPIDAPLEIIESAIKALGKYNTIGLVTTVQHIHQLEQVKGEFEKLGKTVLIGKPYGFAKHQGQILGCDIGSSATLDRKVDCHVYFGGGLFHPLGALYNTTKPFFAIDPFINKFLFLDGYREEHKKRERGKIMRSIEAKRFGILVSTKNGQTNLNLAKVLKRKIELYGCEAAILVANTFDFDYLNNLMEFDAFVNTACPRLTTDDNERLRKPLLSANNVMELLAMREGPKIAQKSQN
ncbi:MAG: diphthamide biosynthesis enzyme Dph2 [Candidatus Micrarchaeota archaeon]|nr:diphthamide biosynthesis enzyme Dph2 [Candidatus Micrarchaeota archaeon]MDE1847603.1 diphthamide biosynthesis enzyme Dph2 [Candidatus Micrarchaeota archaeon]MDE1863806.1 diphthamide biosynthesis enzyme Dph2 [Candidatus Micrarchaeota archaeon]